MIEAILSISVKIISMRYPPTTQVLLSSFLFLLLLTSCSSPSIATNPATLPTETAAPYETSSPTEALLPTETQTPFPTLTPDFERQQYFIDLQLNYAAKAAVVNQTITYPNWTGETLTNLVLAVQPNLWTGGFTIKSMTVNDQPVTSYTMENLSQKLEIALPQPLEPSRTLVLNISYGLILPEAQAYSNPNEVRPQIYGFTQKQVNFVDWYPFIVPYQSGEGWVLHNPWFYGEHLVYDPADFVVNVMFIDGATPQIASSGQEIEAETEGSRRFTMEAARTFALSMSNDFKVAQQTVGDVTVYSYYFGFYDAPGEAMLQTTVDALQTYSEKFGPYRHKTLTAVQGDFNDGMEYSGLYFISRDYFNLYKPDDPVNYLVAIAAHETAHQWWFDGVADDQAIEPWLDEALSTYSERIYYETIYPNYVDAWWSYRYFEFQQAGYVDTPIYDGGGQRPYWDKVYLTGARFLEDLRKQLGDEIFFAFLKNYYTQYAGKHATGADFFRVLHETTSADITELLTKYFKNTY
jgi:aminopeptidase N